MLFNAFCLAISAIVGNWLRSFLTVLGIIIGVAAVIVLVTLGTGTTQQVTSDIEGLGSNLVIVVPGDGKIRGGQSLIRQFKKKDADAIQQQIANVKAVSPSSQKRVVAIFRNENISSTVTGIEAQYFSVFNWEFTKGRAFTPNEIRSGISACIVGETVRKELFGGMDPIGASIRLDGMPCKIVGLLESKGVSAFGSDQDDIILTPLRTFQRRITGKTDISLIAISVDNSQAINNVKRDITYLLRDLRNINDNQDDDFSVRDMTEITDMLSSTTTIMTLLLAAVAGISLLVGGIGIMNIMLVSVTERTREIGIRLAIGAQKADVLLQFLVESIVLSSLGGFIGVLLALLSSYFLSRIIGIPFILEIPTIAVSFLFSALVGVIFGYVPARKAANLNPIEALRYE